MVSMDKLRLETSLASEQGKTFDDIFKSQGKRKCTLLFLYPIAAKITMRDARSFEISKKFNYTSKN